MPHQCVKCNTLYEDAANEILKGCSCGGKLFFYIKKEKLEELKKIAKQVHLSAEEREEIEKDVFDLVGSEAHSQPVVLDFESIRVLKPGQYELDLVELFKNEPIVFRLEEGKYMIDIAEGFKSVRKKKAGKNRF